MIYGQTIFWRGKTPWVKWDEENKSWSIIHLTRDVHLPRRKSVANEARNPRLKEESMENFLLIH